jgi:hypothetical protein
VGSGKLFGKRLNAARVSSQGRLNAEKLTDEHLLFRFLDGQTRVVSQAVAGISYGSDERRTPS